MKLMNKKKVKEKKEWLSEWINDMKDRVPGRKKKKERMRQHTLNKQKLKEGKAQKNGWSILRAKWQINLSK